MDVSVAAFCNLLVDKSVNTQYDFIYSICNILTKNLKCFLLLFYQMAVLPDVSKLFILVKRGMKYEGRNL